MCSDFSCEIYLTMGQLRFFESMHSINVFNQKSPAQNAELLVGKTGFEPATPWSQTRCATTCATSRCPKSGQPPNLEGAKILQLF